jgi:hypothetical protein
MEILLKKKIALPCRESNRDSPVAQPVTWSLYTVHYPYSFLKPQVPHIFK